MTAAPWTIFRINAAMQGNQLIHWFSRVPLVRRLISDSLYEAAGGKLALSVVLAVWQAVKAFAGKFLYLAVIPLVPLFIVFDSVPDALSGAGFSIFCWVLLFLSFVMGSLLRPKVPEATQLKYTCVRMMGMDARLYQLTVLCGHYPALFVTFVPALMTASALFGQGALPGLLLSVELLCARLVGEQLHMLVYRASGKSLCRNALFVALTIILGLAAAYVPAIVVPLEVGTAALMPQRVLLHPAAAVIFAALGAASAVLLARYPNYYRLTLDTCRAEQVSPELAQKELAGAQFADVKLKDSDLTAEGECAELAGWPYLQALFFRRHRRMLYKPVKIALIIWGVVSVLAWAALFFFRGEETAELFTMAPRILPYCVFFLYLLDDSAIGTRICKAMFCNCDLAMLKYGWYRQPGVVLKNFTLRLRRLCAVNLLVSAAVGLSVTIMVLCAGGTPPIGEYLIFLLALLCLGVFFAVHCLGMYYLFQPYTSDLQVQNPFFNAINWVVYILCYLCIQIHSTPSWFGLLVLVVTVLYSAVILLLVWKRSPRTFRVK